MNTVRLCAVCAAHGPAIEYYASDPAVAATTDIPHPYPIGGGDAFAKQAMADWREGSRRAFCILVDHLEAGMIALREIDHEAGHAQLGFWIAKPYWGQGIATRAVSQVVGYAREHLGLDALWSACLAANPASRRVHEKSGFAFHGSFVIGDDHGGKFSGHDALRFHLPLTERGRDQAAPADLSAAKAVA